MSEEVRVPPAAIRAVRMGSGRPQVFHALVVAYSVALAGAVAFAFWVSDGENWGLVAILGLLFIVAEHRDRVFVDETGLSGSIAVALGAAVALAQRDWSAGSVFVCAAGGLYLRHVHPLDVEKIVINAASFGLSGLTAAGVCGALSGPTNSWLSSVFALCAATSAYWVMNSVLLALATAAIGAGSFGSRLNELIRSDLVMLLFGFGGAVCGLVMAEVSLGAGIATLIALLVALDVFVISVPAGLGRLRAAWAVLLARGASGLVAGAVGAVVTRVVGISLLGAVVGLVGGVAAGIVTVVTVVAARFWTMHRSIDPSVVTGLVLVELAFPVIGALSGVATAIAGLDIGLICASALVVVGSIAVAIRRHRAARCERPAVDDDTLFVAVIDALLDGMPDRTRQQNTSRPAGA